MPAVADKSLRDLRIKRRTEYLYMYLENLRKQKHVSQAKAGAALGVSQGRYSQAITDRSLSVTQLMTVLDLLGDDGSALIYLLVGDKKHVEKE